MKYLNKEGRARFVEVGYFGVVDLDKLPIRLEVGKYSVDIIWDNNPLYDEDILTIVHYNSSESLMPLDFGGTYANVIREISDEELIKEMNMLKDKVEQIEQILEVQ